MISVKAKRIFAVILALAFVLILTKPMAAYDHFRNDSGHAYDDMKDTGYMPIDPKDGSFQDDTSDAVVYNHRSYVTSDAQVGPNVIEKSGAFPHDVPKIHNTPKKHKNYVAPKKTHNKTFGRHN